ncbi:O-antigen ligase family protein [Hydrogenophaga sp. PBL-H3]|uniref:O-antigen ligase family protein n=1 Tax=Hydrogenophaga sp. PBL-H3 TaxID=434010 RepID=UPI0013589C6C|nr:O-antigen ligase family protein [Hydrogenophaga sp. PBL-H3]
MALLLGVPTSIALVNIGILLVLVGWLLSGQWRWKLDVIRHNPITLPVMLLSALVLVGIAYTDAPRAYIGHHLYVYSKLPLMLMLLTLLYEPCWQRRGLLAFTVGSLITVASTYANIWFDVPWSDSHNQGLGVTHHVFNDYIAQGLAMSFFTALAVVIALDARTRSMRWAWALVAVFTVFSITHLLQGRTGQVVLLAMLCALAWVAAPMAWRWRALALVVLATVLLFLSSSLLRHRVTSLFTEFAQYTDAGLLTTSTGFRLDMWKNALEMYLTSPLWGHGTASYRVLSEQIYTDPGVCAVSCLHPHNQFLFLAAEFGLLGLVAYVLLLQRAFAAAFDLTVRYRNLLVAFMAILFVDSFINGPFWVTTERHLFASVLPLLVAGWRLPVNKGETVAASEPEVERSA